jgi:8-oxo-dGTP diphosphatase
LGLPSPKAPDVTVVAALIESGRGLVEVGPPSEAGPKVFLARRSAAAGHGGLWELPGGKVEAGESAEEALVREIREELGAGLAIEGKPRRYKAEIEGRSFDFIVFPASFTVPEDESIRLSVHDACRYFTESELEGLELAPLDGPALEDWAADAERRI